MIWIRLGRMVLFLAGFMLCYYLSLVACTHMYPIGCDGLADYALVALYELWELVVYYKLTFIYYDAYWFLLFKAWCLNLLLWLLGR